ncbi:DJ-1/PfpI family protein [Pontibacter sp. MBLB2868]|uniref:DJ-1/PfpI family protein n=1 Tax=Pontibacter sp. MBLB2868 TaxID=3451555 RepID=UPI003F753E8E
MKIVIYIYQGMTMLDAIGPYEVLRFMPGAEVMFVAEKKGEITADSGFVHLQANYSIDEVDSADLLLIPGSGITFVREMRNKKLLHWIKKIDRTSRWTTSVCSGSVILAAAGLLQHVKATSHWKTVHLLEEYGAVPMRRRIVAEGKYLTAAGVSAGIDLGLYIAGQVFGEEEARAIQLLIEYDPAPPYHGGNFLEADKRTISLAEQKMKAYAAQELRVSDLLRSWRTMMTLRRRPTAK